MQNKGYIKWEASQLQFDAFFPSFAPKSKTLKTFQSCALDKSPPTTKSVFFAPQKDLKRFRLPFKSFFAES
jgi:hypothetical protein